MRHAIVIYAVFQMLHLGAKAQFVHITVDDQAGATELVERHIFFNKEHGELPGFRIQVYSGASLSEAKDRKAGFLNKYEMSAMIVFEAPNYKLRIGNYTNRFDANRDLQIIREYYPDAFIVKDLVKLTE